jgi:hypothetical protein
LDCYHIARRSEAIGKGFIYLPRIEDFRTPAVETLASLESREGEGLHIRRTRRSAQMSLHARRALISGELGKYTVWSPSESPQVLAVAK